MSLEITGKLIKILPEQTGEGRNGTWVKSSFVIETQDQYPKSICFDAWGDRVETVKNLKEGTMLKVGFDVESREYNERWYTNAKAWKIETVSEGGSTPPPDMPPPEYKETDIPASEEGDDLPF
jgi:hypothetical protein